MGYRSVEFGKCLERSGICGESDDGRGRLIMPEPIEESAEDRQWAVHEQETAGVVIVADGDGEKVEGFRGFAPASGQPRQADGDDRFEVPTAAVLGDFQGAATDVVRANGIGVVERPAVGGQRQGFCVRCVGGFGSGEQTFGLRARVNTGAGIDKRQNQAGALKDMRAGGSRDHLA